MANRCDRGKPVRRVRIIGVEVNQFEAQTCPVCGSRPRCGIVVGHGIDQRSGGIDEVNRLATVAETAGVLPKGQHGRTIGSRETAKIVGDNDVLIGIQRGANGKTEVDPCGHAPVRDVLACWPSIHDLEKLDRCSVWRVVHQLADNDVARGRHHRRYSNN